MVRIDAIFIPNQWPNVSTVILLNSNHSIDKRLPIHKTYTTPGLNKVQS